jgi:2-oxoisovalerate dehydrogenase E1 component
LAQLLTGFGDAAAVYYRSRPLMLGLGLSLDDALSSTMMRAGGVSDGRDIGVVFNMPRHDGVCVLPACGGVGAQYTPAVGWAQSIRYHTRVLKDARYEGSIAVVHGGEASTATNGFWSALNIATTARLPLLFFIEDNGYGISVKSELQTPGGNIAANLAAFRKLQVLDGNGSDPEAAARLMREAVAAVRHEEGPALLRLTVPRLSGHSGQDTQAYKSLQEIADEQVRDPLSALHELLVPERITQELWRQLEQQARAQVLEALERVERRGPPDSFCIQ